MTDRQIRCNGQRAGLCCAIRPTCRLYVERHADSAHNRLIMPGLASHGRCMHYEYHHLTQKQS